VASFGTLYACTVGYEDVRKMIAENISEEEGFKAIPREGHEPHWEREVPAPSRSNQVHHRPKQRRPERHDFARVTRLPRRGAMSPPVACRRATVRP